jgi:hypothetical protein
MKRRGVSLQPREEAVRPPKRLRRENADGDPLKGWILEHLDPELPDEDIDERCSALVEVGQVLISERDQYPGEKEMRAEVEELVTQLISAEAVTEYISLCLNLRPPPPHISFPPPHMSGMLPPPPPMPFPLFDPMTGMPLYPPPMPAAPTGHNLVFSKTGEPTAVQKLKEREAKRRELLHELSEQLKTLVAKASEQTDPSQKQKYLSLIDGIKKRITALSTTTNPATPSTAAPVPARDEAVGPATAAAGTGERGIVGFYANAYVNPELLKKEEQKKIDEFNARLAKAKALKQQQSIHPPGHSSSTQPSK